MLSINGFTTFGFSLEEHQCIFTAHRQFLADHDLTSWAVIVRRFGYHSALDGQVLVMSIDPSGGSEHLQLPRYSPIFTEGIADFLNKHYETWRARAEAQ